MPTAVIGQPLLLMTAAEGWLGPAAGDRNDVGVHPDTATGLLSLTYIPSSHFSEKVVDGRSSPVGGKTSAYEGVES